MNRARIAAYAGQTSRPSFWIPPAINTPSWRGKGIIGCWISTSTSKRSVACQVVRRMGEGQKNATCLPAETANNIDTICNAGTACKNTREILRAEESVCKEESKHTLSWHNQKWALRLLVRKLQFLELQNPNPPPQLILAELLSLVPSQLESKQPPCWSPSRSLALLQPLYSPHAQLDW